MIPRGSDRDRRCPHGMWVQAVPCVLLILLAVVWVVQVVESGSDSEAAAIPQTRAPSASDATGGTISLTFVLPGAVGVVPRKCKLDDPFSVAKKALEVGQSSRCPTYFTLAFEVKPTCTFSLRTTTHLLLTFVNFPAITRKAAGPRGPGGLLLP
jgi:hypothetical protein